MLEVKMANLLALDLDQEKEPLAVVETEDHSSIHTYIFLSLFHLSVTCDPALWKMGMD
jgi:hypothetical protein